MNAPATSRWLIIPRIGSGTRRLATSLGRWHTGRGLTGIARVRAILGRLVGALAVTWFIGGMLWALGTPPWAIVPMWLTAAITASYHDAQDAGEQAEENFTAADFIELLHDVARGGNVHLTAIRAQILEETGRDWDVLALCRKAGIPTKAVRVSGADPAVTTGIHRADLPPLPRGSSPGPEGVLTSNNNSNNTTSEEISEGVVIIKTGPSIHQEAHR